MITTEDKLRQLRPWRKADKRALMFPFLEQAMQEFEIIGLLRESAFLAQLAHESAELRYMEEIASGSAYEGRRDLGNTRPGDGKRYKGRGPIQLTGRANYQKYGHLLGLDLVNHPEHAALPQLARLHRTLILPVVSSVTSSARRLHALQRISIIRRSGLHL